MKDKDNNDALKLKFSRELFRNRSRCGLTQSKVAEAVSISERWYQTIESGGNIPSTKVTLRLMKLLDIKLEALYPEIDLFLPTN